MSEDITNPQSQARGRYLSLVVHIRVGDDGELLRGTIEDANTGKWLAIDLSSLAALLRESLAHTPGQGKTRKMEEKGLKMAKPMCKLEVGSYNKRPKTTVEDRQCRISALFAHCSQCNSAGLAEYKEKRS